MCTRGETLVVAAVMAAVVITLERPAPACGPDFPVELLSQRESTLYGLRGGVFLVEATRLVAPPSRPYRVVVGDAEPKQRPVGSGEEAALYARGAKAYNALDFAAARRAFEAVLALPAEQRRQRSTSAAYMLGRIGDVKSAVAAYRKVRALVDAGFADPLGLASSSLGQEARLELNRGRVLTAVKLYATQAAHGHPSGAASLLFVARQLIRDDRTADVMGDPVGQRLLAAYLYTRSDEMTDRQRRLLWRSLASQSSLAGADRLAAAAYQQGKWKLAGRISQRAPKAPLSLWVQAKLAVRAGETAKAEQRLAAAVRALEGQPASCSAARRDRASAVRRVHGELAILALAAGKMSDAMNQAYAATGEFPDAVYIAERVLTIAELRRFVDELPSREPVGQDWGDVNRTIIREILARRLMRLGAFDEALAYFEPVHRVHARAYGEAIVSARNSSDDISRAEHLYRASQLARKHGLEILGTAHAPDWGLYGAGFDLGEWRRTEPHGHWTNATEAQRIKQSAPSSLRRFHYRFVASKLAERAADLLPKRSQAFAATLCHGARYVYSRDGARVRALWQRYTRDGPSVAFASTFGIDCPAPKFTAARRYLPKHVPSKRVVPISLALFGFAVIVLYWRSRRL